jgi:O-antigen ligase
MKRPIGQQEVTTSAVALGVAALGFADGGYGPRAYAVMTIATWLGAAAGVLRGARPRDLSPTARLAIGTITGLALLSALSMAWADDAGRAFLASVQVAGYAGLVAIVLAWVRKTGPRPWLAGVAIGLAAIALAALASRFDPSILGGGDRTLNETLPTAAGRLSYPIGYWNGLAACLALGFALSLWFGVRGGTVRVRALAAGTLPAHGLGLYLTSSRGGAVSALVGLVVLTALERERAALLATAAVGALGTGVLIALAHGSSDFLGGLDTSDARAWGAAMAVGGVAVCVAVGLTRHALDSRLANRELHLRIDRRRAAGLVVLLIALVVALNPAARVREFKHADFRGLTGTPGQRSFVDTGGSGRYQFWGAALDAWADKPVGGLGAGNYELYWNAHPAGPVAIRNAHSLYLETLAELGPLGLALVLGFLGVPAVAGWRSARRTGGGDAAAAVAVIAVAALTAAVDWTWQLPAAVAPAAIAIALVVANRDGRAGGVGRLRVAEGLALAAFAWAAVWAAGIVFVDEALLGASRSAASRGDLATAAARAQTAASLEPFSVEPPLQLAVVERQGGDLEAARSDARRAVELASGDWRGWYVASRIAADAGRRAAAERDLHRARQLAPLPLATLR